MKPHSVQIWGFRDRALAHYDVDNVPVGWIVSFRPATEAELAARLHPVQPIQLKDYSIEDKAA